MRPSVRRHRAVRKKSSEPSRAGAAGGPEVGSEQAHDRQAASDTTKSRQAVNLTRSVYEQLRTEVLNGSLRPGEKLTTVLLRSRFRIGGSPVREALNRLLSEGFVNLEDQKGFRVAGVSHRELAELVQARCWIDGMAVTESVRRFETAWEENLVLALHRLAKATRNELGQGVEWEGLHKAFHAALVSGCGTRWMVRISAQLFDAAERYRLLAANHIPERNELDEHRAIVDACFQRDAGRAVDLLKAHYGKTFEQVIARSLLPAEPEPPGAD